jgi:Glycosyltransferase family 92
MTKYHLTACLMFKDAATYLDEWLRFHLNVGFDHFYLFDNNSSDDYDPILQPFIDAGQVTLTVWPGIAQMERILSHCLEVNRDATRWMAFLDDDEFLFPAAADTVPEVLKQYESFAGLAVCWLVFGSSGHQTRPPGLVTTTFRRREASVNAHVKCIVNPQKVISPAIIGHAFVCRPGEVIVDEKFEPMTGPLAMHPTSNVICLNHYISKSFAEMRQRRSGLPACKDEVIYTYEQYAEADARLNDVEDLRIQRFAQAVQGQQPGRLNQ